MCSLSCSQWISVALLYAITHILHFIFSSSDSYDYSEWVWYIIAQTFSVFNCQKWRYNCRDIYRQPIPAFHLYRQHTCLQAKLFRLPSGIRVDWLQCFCILRRYFHAPLVNNIQSAVYFTNEEDGFKNGRAIIEAGDVGNNFRVFSSTAWGHQDIWLCIPRLCPT